MNFEELLDKARQGDERAIATLGGELSQFMVDDPIPIEEGDKNYDAGEDVLRDLAEDGNAEAQYWLGRCILFLREEAGKELDYETLDWWERAADQGHARVTWDLGRAYEIGWGDAGLDIVKAAQWYRMGVERGDKKALEALGQLDALREQAEQWSDEEAPQLLWENLTEAMDEGKIGSYSGDEDFARFVLGLLFLYGNDTVPPNMKRAAGYLSESGHWNGNEAWSNLFKPALEAAENGEFELLKALLASDPDINAVYGFGNSAMWVAAEHNNNPEVFKMLLNAGASMDIDDEDGYTSTALIEAAGSCKNPEVLKVLLEAGADVNATTGSGTTALLAAACNNDNPEVHKVLLDAGANLNARDEDGMTALDYAEENDYAAVAELLREAGAVNGERGSEDEDDSRATSLIEAATNGDLDEVKAKLADGTDVNARNNEGETALMCAAKNGDPAMVKALLDVGAHVNAANQNGRTALMRAAWTGNLEAAKLLLDTGAEVDAARNDGVTALMMAAQNGHTEVVKALLDAGADVNAKYEDGRTALDFAEKYNQVEIADLLRAAAPGAASADAEDDDAPLCLSKGETLSLGKKAPGLQKLLVGLGWDVNEDGGDFDLDASAFLLGENGKCAKVKDVVFYGSLEHPSGAVKHLGDNRTGEGEGDDEQLVVDLAKAPESVTRIVFAVSIHEAGERGQTFGQVENAFIRVVDEASGRELARYEPASEFSDETALVVGELYRDGDDWQFRAVGDGLQGGLAALCGRYGIKTA